VGGSKPKLCKSNHHFRFYTPPPPTTKSLLLLSKQANRENYYHFRDEEELIDEWKDSRGGCKTSPQSKKCGRFFSLGGKHFAMDLSMYAEERAFLLMVLKYKEMLGWRRGMMEYVLVLLEIEDSNE